jgi:hypothetical protein
MQFATATTSRRARDRRLASLPGCTRSRQRPSPRDGSENTNCHQFQGNAPACSVRESHCRASAAGCQKDSWREPPAGSDVIECADLTRMSMRPSTCGVYLASSPGSPVGVFKPQSEEQIPDDFAAALSKGHNLYRYLLVFAYPVWFARLERNHRDFTSKKR